VDGLTLVFERELVECVDESVLVFERQLTLIKAPKMHENDTKSTLKGR
jgi:hypothetical protein